MNSHCQFPNCVSASIIKRFLDDPLQWYKETTQNIEFGSAYTFAGSLFHDAISTVLCVPAPGSNPPAVLTEDEVAEARLRADAAYFTWYQDFQLRRIKAATLAGRPMVEQEFSITVPGIEFPIVGTVDFVSTNNMLLDWKMTTVSPEVWVKRNRNNYQHYFYTMWFLKEIDPGASHAQFFYVLVGQDKVHWLNYSVNADEVANWIENTLKPVVGMMKGALRFI